MNYLNKAIVSGAIVASLGLGACTDGPEPAGNGINGKLEIPSLGSMEFDNAEASVNSGLNNFAFKFLNQSAADMESSNTNDGNIVVSPLSASLALALVANSCDDEATQAISEMLGIDNTENLNLTVNKLMRFLSATGEGETLDLANSVWYDDSLAPDEAWKNTLRSDLYSATSPLDFSSDTAVDVINNWCSMNTNGMIRDFIKYIDPMTQVCFLNAMYYVGKWEDPFSKESTDTATFKGKDGDTKVNMMHAVEVYKYYKAENFEMLSIPFRGKNKMTLLLPDEDMTATEVVKQLNIQDFNRCLSNSRSIVTILSMPKFNCETEIDITDILTRVGLPDSMSLTKMGINSNLNAKAKQKNVTQIDEEGSVVANVTVVAGEGSIYRPITETITISFDRPFVFFIHNYKTGTILISGIINNL